MWKQHEVIMLPTEVKIKFNHINTEVESCGSLEYNLKELKKGNVTRNPFEVPITILENGQMINSLERCDFPSKNDNFYHLYIISSEEIKEGDWYMYCHFGEWIISNSRETLKNETNTLENLNKDDYFKKIIATTDKSLTKGMYCVSTGKYQESLPQPSQSFIEKFVDEYNKGNIITEVMVEYEEPYKNLVGSMVGSNIGHFILTEENKYRIKINPNNTINIKPIKDNWVELPLV